ncbi:SDR family NAD(P)-dependent oxidoreductase [Lacicoccus qingdaonensis]|uniref:3-oxoacyl-[acyl-carrier protein] reductase n=1 Tax=Lacicoccus qingdaonensis TaxID=576118 RepID=A0A1G9JBE6_9BACL|nr:SDR family NAD(P)-dependent oxidoreductase [Salinicoccus qingdaonensis]SDL34536.1 3-oxoacyl-[acyl-carrier protein] reductase [Salinicoccus qingdaonensis]
MKLENRVAVITGAGPGGGIGYTIALAFLQEGAKVSLNYLARNDEEKETFEKEMNQYADKVIITEGDISQEEVSEKLISNTVKKYGKIDILINSAGISTPSLLQDMKVSNWDRMMDVNLKSVFLTTKSVIPFMVSQEFGRIINISSQVGQKGSVEHSHYAAAKAGVIAFTKSVAREVGRYGVTANCIAPGPIETSLMNEVSETWKQEKMKELVIPRLGEVEEVAPTAVFLASSPDGDLYTGQTLGPNSGDVML